MFAAARLKLKVHGPGGYYVTLLAPPYVSRVPNMSSLHGEGSSRPRPVKDITRYPTSISPSASADASFLYIYMGAYDDSVSMENLFLSFSPCYAGLHAPFSFTRPLNAGLCNRLEHLQGRAGAFCRDRSPTGPPAAFAEWPRICKLSRALLFALFER